MELKNRLIGVIASLFLSVPLCALVWVVVNFMLIRLDPSIYIEESYLLYTIIVLSVIAFISPDLYTKMIGFIFGTNKNIN